MMDIVERLRRCDGINSGDPLCCCAEAAAEIEQLRAERDELFSANGEMSIDLMKQRAEIERLRAAPSADGIDAAAQEIAYVLGYVWGSSALDHDMLREAARRVLEDKP